MGEGPKLKIRDVEFVGNDAISDGTLQKKIKENKPKNPLYGWISGGGTYKEAMFEEDAAKVVEYYQNRGYPQARVGQPEVKTLEDSKDGKTRWIQLRIPVTEGERYRFGRSALRGQQGRSQRGSAHALHRPDRASGTAGRSCRTATRRRRRSTAAAGTWSSRPSRC